MEYLFVLNVIALAVVIGFMFTYWDSENTQDSLADPKPKKCPSCGEEIESDILRCRQCGTFVDFFRKKP